jgi:hypothetical protein
VLRPGGGLSLVWNTRDLSDPLHRRIEAVVKQPRDAAAGRAWHLKYDDPERPRRFGGWEEWRHSWTQEFDRELLRERFRSVSFVAQMVPAEQQALLDRVVAAVDDLPERFPFPYVTEIFTTFRHTGPR